MSNSKIRARLGASSPLPCRLHESWVIPALVHATHIRIYVMPAMPIPTEWGMYCRYKCRPVDA
eukprot:11502564-Heterocapsa_arctica.AAC.1